MARARKRSSPAVDNQGIEIHVHQHRPLAERFQMLPNALLRGDYDPDGGYDFRGYTLRERAMLGALVGMAEGYRCSRARIEALAPELGVDAVDTVVKGLRKKGHLRQTRVNDPETGKFVWRWDVSLEPAFLDAAEETAGHTMGGSSTHGSSMHGSAMGGQSGSKYLEDQGLEDQKINPPTPQVIDTGVTSSPVPTQKRGGESSPRTKSTPSPSGDAPDVAAAAAELAALASPAKPGWTVAATVAALAELLAEGRRTWPTILLVARRAATDPATLFPGRMVRGQIPEEWWAQATPPTARAKTCGCLRGVVLVEEIVDGIPTGRDRPQPCPDCSASAVAA